MRPAKKRRLLEGEIAQKGTVIGAGGGRRQLVVTQDNSGGLARAGGSVTGEGVLEPQHARAFLDVA